MNGHYEGEYFTHPTDHTFSVESPTTIRRLRAAIQYKNSQFSKVLRTHGHKYHINEYEVDAGRNFTEKLDAEGEAFKLGAVPDVSEAWVAPPIQWGKPQAMEWVREALFWTRGRELPGNFNPLLIGGLF